MQFSGIKQKSPTSQSELQDYGTYQSSASTKKTAKEALKETDKLKEDKDDNQGSVEEDSQGDAERDSQAEGGLKKTTKEV